MNINIEYEYKKFNLNLRERVTIIQGDSGTGKTLFAKAIKAMERAGIDDNSYVVIDPFSKLDENKLKDIIDSSKNKLIVIDNADSVLGKETIELINYDDSNRYILIGRALWTLNVTPNSVSEMVYNASNREFNLHYKYNKEGWRG